MCVYDRVSKTIIFKENIRNTFFLILYGKVLPKIFSVHQCCLILLSVIIKTKYRNNLLYGFKIFKEIIQFEEILPKIFLVHLTLLSIIKFNLLKKKKANVTPISPSVQEQLLDQLSAIFSGRAFWICYCFCYDRKSFQLPLVIDMSIRSIQYK